MNAGDESMQVLASSDAVVASGILDEVLRNAVAGRTPTAWTAAQLRELWATVEAGGWDRLAADGTSGLGLRDVVEIGLVLGRYVAPAPIGTTIALSAQAGFDPGARPLSVALPRRGNPSSARAVYGRFPGVRVINTSEGIASGQARDFAPSLLVAETATAVLPLDRHAVRWLAVVWTAESVGAARALLSNSIEYAKTREQFGRPIGQFQAIKHLLADALLAYQEAVTATVQVANTEDPPAATLRLIFERCIAISESAAQVHGGIGMTWELGHHYFARHIIELRDLFEDLYAQKGL